MISPAAATGIQKTTSYKVVLPFYAYGALSFLLACAMLLINTDIVRQHYFHPQTLAITHLMALGWGTMIIMGASHQLLPVIIEGKLDSDLLAYLSFVFVAIGIPFLVIGFYIFHLGWVLQTGAILINLGVICYFINVVSSIYESKKHEVYAWFMITAALWLFATTFFGLLLVFNFTRSWLPENSLEYLSIHAHMGIAGWFLLLVLGVASRLIPMFLISKYTNTQLLWWIYILVNAALLGFIVLKSIHLGGLLYYAPFLLGAIALALFGRFCYQALKARIRKQVDEQMKMSLLSVILFLLPLISLLLIISILSSGTQEKTIILYGFGVFFGWITAIILGMTFKTLPFIVWNKVYRTRATGKTPAPKELFSERIFNIMAFFYLTGFLLFVLGMTFTSDILIKSGAASLLMSAICYVCNVVTIFFHQPENHGSKIK